MSSDETVLVRADAEKVRQILLNLVTNAVKFTDSGGLVAVECAADATCVRVVVRDTGRGIPAEHLDRIVDPFVQIDGEQTPKSQQSVGLGLSAVVSSREEWAGRSPLPSRSEREPPSPSRSPQSLVPSTRAVRWTTESETPTFEPAEGDGRRTRGGIPTVGIASRWHSWLLRRARREG